MQSRAASQLQSGRRRHFTAIALTPDLVSKPRDEGYGRAAMRLSRWWHALACAIVCLHFTGAAVAGVHRRLAVLEFSGQALDPGVLNAFSDAVRGSALAVLGNRDIKVMTREAMLAILRDMGKAECVEGDCEVETARNIGADYVVSGAVVFIEGTYVVTLKLHETKEGALLATEEVQAKSQLETLGLLKQQGRKLVAGLSTSPSAVQLESLAPLQKERAPVPSSAPPRIEPPPRAGAYTEEPPRRPTESDEMRSQTSGLAWGAAIGTHAPGVGVEAALYLQVSESFRLVPFGGLGYASDRTGYAAGAMGVLGGQRRFVLDCAYVAVGSAMGIMGLAGYEYMSDGGFFVRLAVGVGYYRNRTDISSSSGSTITEWRWSPGPALNLAVGYKLW